MMLILAMWDIFPIASTYDMKRFNTNSIHNEVYRFGFKGAKVCMTRDAHRNFGDVLDAVFVHKATLSFLPQAFRNVQEKWDKTKTDLNLPNIYLATQQTY